MTATDPRRRFTSTQRVALYLTAAGQCANCAGQLELGWHADHRHPHSKGGATDTPNGAATCPSCNLTKGARTMTQPQSHEPRQWQQAATAAWRDHTTPDFLLVACPGAGKTRWALTATTKRLAFDTSQLVVVVPSEQLKHQWARNAAEHGIQLKPDWRNSDAAWPNDFHGVVVTYAQIASQPHLLRHHVGRTPTGVICDEVHHAGDELAWGRALREAIEPATWRLALSGTPFRTDGTAIPFIRYDDGGLSLADFTYGYADAVEDEVCRGVLFPQYDGTVEWLDVAGLQSATFDDHLDAAGTSRRLRTALTAAGGFMRQTLGDAHRALERLRTEAPRDADAGGLVIAQNQEHAMKLAAQLERITGTAPDVAVSDDPDARARIDAYATGTQPWLVAVRMVSEGVDIPRLRVLVYATNVVAPLFFRQAIGRVVRVRPDIAVPPREQRAYAYLPSDPRLRELARTVAQEVGVALADPVEQQAAEPVEPREAHDEDVFYPLHSDGALARITEAGESVRGDELTRAQVLGQQAGFSDDPAVLLRIANLLRLVSSDASTTPPAAPAAQKPLYERIRDLRGDNKHLANALARATGADHAHVNATLNQAVGVSRVAEATEAQLIERCRVAREWLSNAQAA